MNSILETLEDNKVKLSVTIDEVEFEPELDAAYKRISKEVRMPGFRPGKVPRKLLEKQLGPAMAREEAMRSALPAWYSNAVLENDVDVVASPDIEITGGEETGEVTFDAIVEIRPTISIAGHDGLRVEIVSPIVVDDDIEARLDSIRRQHSVLETTARPAADGDHVLIDIEGTIEGEAVSGLTAEDYDYVVGSGAVVAEIDEHVIGASADDTLKFSADHPDEADDSTIDFVITLHEVQEQALPEPDDAFAAEASEFETIAELRDDLAHQLEHSKIAEANKQLYDHAGEALARLVTDDLSEALIEGEMESRAQDFVLRIQSMGIEIEQYMQMTGTTPEQFREDLREQSETGVRVDLALRAVVEREAIEVDDDTVDDELRELATQLDKTLAEVKEQLEQTDRLKAIRSDLQIRAALDWVIDRAEIVDTDGNIIDKDMLEQPEHDHADHVGSEEE